MATLFLTCGLQGAGKTTLARRLEAERPTLRLTSDECLHDLYPELTAEELEPFCGTVEQVHWSVTVRALELGCDVVLDWGPWSRQGRDRLRTGAGRSKRGWCSASLARPATSYGTACPAATRSCRQAPSTSVRTILNSLAEYIAKISGAAHRGFRRHLISIASYHCSCPRLVSPIGVYTPSSYANLGLAASTAPNRILHPSRSDQIAGGTGANPFPLRAS